MNTLIIEILVGVVLVITMVVLLKLKRKKAIRNKLQSAVRHLILMNKLAIANLEWFNNKMIGIDKKNRKLIFVQVQKDEVQKLCIDLRLASTCRVVKTNHDDEIFLQLQLKNSNDLTRINFYDSSSDHARNKTTLLEKARAWKERISLLMRGASHNFHLEYAC